MKIFRTLSFVLMATASVGASAMANTAQPADPRALLRKVNAYCPGGIERILPGEYYFCAAARDFGKNHDARARERLRDAAYWASKPAQYVLGLMYFNGDDGPINRPLGVAWLALASERHDPRFEPAFAKAYLQLSPAEKTQADAYWVDMREKYGDRTAGTRAHRIYLAEMRNLQAALMFGGSVFIDGIAPPNGDSVGSFNGPGGARASSVGSGSTGFTIQRLIGKSGDEFFRGLNGTVTVGDAEMVPLGNVVTKASPKAD
ncbi:SEL1-like repeat protein [Luteibacter sp. 22Crub2.1]|uniref:SEL1-like repeat protein n=1 Tax=Luteibacter sp. 22Crub2.1 TaxID=1283288 RepID=UPI0009CA395A|nr:SEL1-like repeat protein [Luteibacter sp. 22Crub2.1]SKB72081.1 hypothetical protein SAMN05660880_02333 [Luteibacter sp. 22Crub2.1]